MVITSCSCDECREVEVRCSGCGGVVGDLTKQLTLLNDELASERKCRAEVGRMAEERHINLKIRSERDQLALRQLLEECSELKDEIERLHSSTTTDKQLVRLAPTVIDKKSSLHRKKLFEKGTHHTQNCSLCLSPFTMIKREHHCRTCYQSVCSDCSRNKASHRNCDFCHTIRSITSTVWSKGSSIQPLTWSKSLQRIADSILVRYSKEKGKQIPPV